MSAAILAAVVLVFMTNRDVTTDFESGWSAYQRGDFVTAVHEVQPLVE